MGRTSVLRIGTTTTHGTGTTTSASGLFAPEPCGMLEGMYATAAEHTAFLSGYLEKKQTNFE
jgi:hypothetical protein